MHYWNVVILLSVQVLGNAYTLARGGSPERWGAWIYIVNWFASNVVLYLSGRHFMSPEMGLIVVDLAYFFATIALALRAQRYWPLWSAALQLDGLLTHFLMFSKTTPPFSYAFALWLWGLPIPILTAVGAWRHRQRVKRWGDDPAWT